MTPGDATMCAAVGTVFGVVVYLGKSGWREDRKMAAVLGVQFGLFIAALLFILKSCGDVMRGGR